MKRRKRSTESILIYKSPEIDEHIRVASGADRSRPIRFAEYPVPTPS
jgi:hypothetical protein